MSTRKTAQRGNAIIEFALVASFLVPMFAAAFSMGMMLVRGIQVGTVCHDADMLFVRSVVDPASGLDLSQSYNQAILVRAAQGLGMTATGGNGVVILNKIIHVSDLSCAAGNIGNGKSAPWSTANCPNYDSYVIGANIVIGNSSRSDFASRFGAAPTGLTQTKGNFYAADIANTTTLQIPNQTAFKNRFPGPTPGLAPDTFALVSEMFADISNLNLFSIMQTPIVYSYNIT